MPSTRGNDMTDQPLIRIDNLSVAFASEHQEIQAVRGVSFDIRPGETLALVGANGPGESVSAHAILRRRASPRARHPSGRVLCQGQDLLNAPEKQLRKVRGNRISMTFQEPMSSLSPLHTVERQINEVLFLHKGLDKKAARARTLELLDLVGIPEPAKRLSAYPHELSGGQRQRVMIAMALANED